MAGSSEEQWLTLARIGRPWGVRGEVAVELHTDWPEQRFEVGASLHLRWDNGRTGSCTVAKYRPNAQGAVMAFEGVEDIPAARQFRGAWIVARREDLTDPEDGFIRSDLVGLKVVSLDGSSLGEVVEVEEAVANDLLVVELANGEQVLVPFANAICPKVDLDARTVLIDPPAGLLDPENAVSQDPEQGS